MLNKKVVVALLAGALFSASALAGVYVRSNIYVENEGVPVVLEKVDTESEQVIETITFRLGRDDMGFLVPVDIVSINLEGETFKNPNALLAPSSIVLNNSYTSGDITTPSGVAVEASGTVSDDDVLGEETEEQEGVKNVWTTIQKGLSTTAGKLEVLYESLKTKVSEGSVHQAPTISDGAGGATADESEGQVDELPQVEAEEPSQTEATDQVK